MLPIFETLLRPDSPAWLGEHQVGGAALVAGPVLLEIAQRALRRWRGKVAASVGQFAIESPLAPPPEGRRVQLQLVAEQGGAVRFSVYSAPVGGADEWTAHAAGVLMITSPAEATSDVPVNIPTRPGRRSGRSPLRAAGMPRHRSGRGSVRCAAPGGATVKAIAGAHACGEGAPRARCLGPSRAARRRDPSGRSCGAGSGTDSEIYLLAEIERHRVPQCPIPGWHPSRDRACRLGADPRNGAPTSSPPLPKERSLERSAASSCKRAPRKCSHAPGSAGGRPRTCTMSSSWQDAEPGGTVAPQLLSPTEFAPSLRASFTALVERNGMEVYGPLLEALDRLSLQHVADALRTLGLRVWSRLVIHARRRGCETADRGAPHAAVRAVARNARGSRCTSARRRGIHGSGPVARGLHYRPLSTATRALRAGRRRSC